MTVGIDVTAMTVGIDVTAMTVGTDVTAMTAGTDVTGTAVGLGNDIDGAVSAAPFFLDFLFRSNFPAVFVCS